MEEILTRHPDQINLGIGSDGSRHPLQHLVQDENPTIRDLLLHAMIKRTRLHKGYQKGCSTPCRYGPGPSLHAYAP